MFRPARWGVRLRSAVLSMLVMTAALLIVAAALLWTLKESLESGAASESSARAEQISVALAEDAPAELDPILFVSTGNTLATQIVDSAGTIVRASPGAPATPLTDARPAPGQRVDLGRQELDASIGDYWIVAQGVATDTGTYVVIVGSFQEPTEDTLKLAAVALAVTIPIIVGVVGLATYLLVGIAFKPVESIRRRVSAISSADLSERVPVPTTEDEIGRLAVTMNEMLARLQAGQLAQQGFVGDASHELRSPLATIIATLELADSRRTGLGQELVADTLLPEARRMQQLVDDLLLLATADERGLHPHRIDVDLDDVVHQEARRVRDLVLASDGAVTVRADCPPLRISADLGQVTRLLRNLLENAVRHARQEVLVQARPLGRSVEITVADDGPGIPAPDRQRVLRRFVRLDTDRARSGGGSGLGLAIVAEIAQAHGGTVSIDRSASGGALVIVRLPADQEQAADAETGRTSVDQGDSASS
ncbi:sensor histidine kinase [Nakamurella silvestris]|nr:sensor histidine kinase [Nakamurella silvestris]